MVIHSSGTEHVLRVVRETQEIYRSENAVVLSRQNHTQIPNTAVTGHAHLPVLSKNIQTLPQGLSGRHVHCLHGIGPGFGSTPVSDTTGVDTRPDADVGQTT
jgi:hypothetical protein